MVDNYVVQTVEYIWKPERQRQKWSNTNVEEYLHGTNGDTVIFFPRMGPASFPKKSNQKISRPACVHAI
jgi:hypothetical protein